MTDLRLSLHYTLFITKNTPITIFTGAGVSIGARLPSWDEIVDRLASLLKNEYGRRHRNLSSIEIDQFFRAGFEFGEESTRKASFLYNAARRSMQLSEHEFAELLKQALYPSKANNVNQNVNQRKRLYPQTELLNAISDAVFNLRKDSSLHKVNVLTYNFDDLLDYTFFNRHQMTNQVQHCHGYLPQLDSGIPGWQPQTDEKIVFTDESYMDLLTSNNSGNNSIQKAQEDALGNHLCCLIGFSLSDIDQRRLLRKVHNIYKHHYNLVFMQRPLIQNNVRREPARIRRLREDLISVEEESLHHLGLVVSWFDDFAELPQRVTHFFQQIT